MFRYGGVMERAELKKYFMSKEFKDKYIYNGDDLGAAYSKNGTIFKVWAPTASEVSLNLYTAGSDDEGSEKIGTYPMEKQDKGVYVFDSSKLGDLKNKYYTYNVTADGETKETADVYAKASGVNGKRSMVVDLEATNPEGFEKDDRLHIDKSDVIIYELHIKDFSHDPHSGIKEEYRGKYKAFTQKDTWLNGDAKTGFPTCVNYLKELGVTYVHLLPAFDFESIDESVSSDDFNWGYDPKNYNVPEGSYSTNPFDGNVRIKEFKEMVMALHQANIGVVMDVVYNHTFNLDSSFQKTVPYYYYRLNDDGTFSNGSACGNETCSEHEMFRKFMVESVKYWATEYHIDGFRFDLMGLHDTQTLKEIRDVLDSLPDGKNMLMYGEPWFADKSTMEEGYIPAITANIKYIDKGISIFSDSIRDAVKGSVFKEKEPGYINSKEQDSKNFVDEIKEAVHLPQRVAYVSSHDNYTLYDKLILSTDIVDKTNVDNMYNRNDALAKLNEFAAGIVFTTSGMVFFQAGEEFLRTKHGIGDSYKSPIEINRLDWTRAYENRDVIEYYKSLIKVRKQYKCLSNADNQGKIEFVDLFKEKDNVVSFILDDTLLVVYNPNKEDLLVSDTKYKKILIPTQEKKNVVRGNSIAIMEL